MGQGRPGSWARALGGRGGHGCSVPRVSLEFKPTAASRASTPRGPCCPVALGTALVLVTYVTPIATIPATAADLGAGPVARAWILSSMSVGLAGLLLASGVLGDALGRRRVYVAGLVATGVGAVLCAVARRAAAVRGRAGRRRAAGAPPCWRAGWPCCAPLPAGAGAAPRHRRSGAPRSGSGSLAGPCSRRCSTSGSGWRPSLLGHRRGLALLLVPPSLRWMRRVLGRGPPPASTPPGWCCSSPR